MKNNIKLLIAIAFLFSGFYCNSQSRYFMKVEGPGLNGNSQTAPHINEFELETFSFGASQSGSTHTGAISKKPDLLPFSISLRQSKNLNTVYQKIHDGGHLAKVTISAVKTFDGGLEDYLVITLEKVLFTFMRNSASINDVGIISAATMFGSKLKVDYYVKKPDGSRKDVALTTKWDIISNTSY